MKKEMDNFMEVIAQGLSSQMILEQIKQRESRLEVLEKRISRLEQIKTDVILECTELEASAREILSGFDEMLQSDISNSRKALRALLTDANGSFSANQGGPRTKKGSRRRDHLGTCTLDGRTSV